MEKNATTFDEFVRFVGTQRIRPGQRPGQHAFNALTGERPDIANQIRGRYFVDPFENDDVLPAFWAAVENLW